MRIGLNISGIGVSSQLERTSKAFARALARLSSGKRVSSPRDDAAAYSLGVRLTSQIRGIAQANLNLNSSLGIVQTASEAISVQLDLVQRMRELALQASNGLLTDADRNQLNFEVQSLKDEFNRIASNTSFGGRKLLDGTSDSIRVQAGSQAENYFNFTLPVSTSDHVFNFQEYSVAGNGTYGSRSTITAGAGTDEVQAVDLNGDGNLDVITADDDAGTVSISLGNGNGTFQTRETLDAALGASVVGVTDFNEDGKLDLVVANQDVGIVSYYLGNGNGTFQAEINLTVGTTPRSLDVGDFNNDGYSDFITVDQGSSEISILLGNGNGTFQTRTTKSLGVGGSYIDTGDLNSDGYEDLVITEIAGNSEVLVLLGNGNGTFQNGFEVTVGASPYRPVLGDLNGDGRLDIVTANNGSNTLSIILGNGNGTFQAQSLLTVSNGPEALAIKDLNGDGKLDIVSGEISAAPYTLSIFLGNGNGTFQARSTKQVGSAPASVAIGDLNNDGAEDLLAAEFSAATVSIFLGNATTTTTTLTAANVSVGTQEDAATTLEILESAVNLLLQSQSQLTAIHSRLNAAVGYNLIVNDSYEEARSNAIDSDFASELSELVRNQILQEAQIAVLAQANLQSQVVIQLLDEMMQLRDQVEKQPAS